MSDRTKWTMVVAIAQNGVIGRNDALPWRLSSDLRRFKSMTMGNCLLMGRKTYESIGKPLPGRQTIVLSAAGFQPGFEEVNVASNLANVDALVESGREVMVVGGAQIYAAAVGKCQTIWLTRVLADIVGDTYFPKIDWTEWQLESAEPCAAGPKDEWPTEFQVWRRRAQA